MSKRDEDSGAHDLSEVGMTTAERRRRRRRGGGLRVPSDNVPRRSPTQPPVSAPVPEDPALAMSIAYSFTSDGSEPVPRVEHAAPTFMDPVAPEGMATVIDPPSSPVEGADFETKTREMSSVDLAALGLEDPSPKAEPVPPPPVVSRTSSVDIDVDVEDDEDEELETFDGEELDPANTLETPMRAEARPHRPSEPPPMRPRISTERGVPPVQAQAPAPVQAQAPAPAAAPAERPQRDRLKTVALSEEDLEDVRDAVRAASQPAAVAVPEPSTLPSNATQPLTALDLEPADDKPAASSAMMNGSVPEIDINELAERSEGSGEIDITDRSEGSGEIDVSVEEEAAEEPVAAAPPPPTAPRQRAASVPPPHTPQVKDTTSPIPRVTPPQAPPQAHLPHGKDKDPHAHPPPTPAKTPPSPPPKTAPKPAAAAPAPAKPEGKAARGKPWFVDLFDEDYLRTLPFLTPQATQSEAEFVIDAMGLSPGAQVLDVGCGYGRHAMELAARGFHVVGLDMSTPLLVRGGEEATRRGLEINFVRGDMRELDFDAQFDGAYCLFSTFGYFDDETNKKTVTNIARALKPGGRMMIEILNRDYIIADLPTRVWWEGEGCVVLEEVELNYFSSRIQVNRSVVFDDGRQLEQEISVRAYSLHEVGKLLHSAGFRVLEVSGGYHTRGRFFGNQSRHIIVLAERKDPAGA